MAVEPKIVAPTPKPEERIPPLQNGDRLTRAEFERRYDAMPELKKAELIEGVVYMPSPVYFEDHGEPHFNLITWLGQYCIFTPGIRGGDNSSIRLDVDNMPQPDACLIISPDCGGQAKIDKERYIAGAPELIAEVAASSASYGLGEKLKAYRRNGVCEYVVWRVFDNAVDWFVLREGRYDRLPPGDDGIYRSEVLPGLCLDPAALLRGDLAAVARTQQQGVESAEHAAFVERLRQAKAEKPE
jgi:Uma2 family endonuclease